MLIRTLRLDLGNRERERADLLEKVLVAQGDSQARQSALYVCLAAGRVREGSVLPCRRPAALLL